MKRKIFGDSEAFSFKLNKTTSLGSNPDYPESASGVHGIKVDRTYRMPLQKPSANKIAAWKSFVVLIYLCTVFLF